jgi:hypothetical protein
VSENEIPKRPSLKLGPRLRTGVGFEAREVGAAHRVEDVRRAPRVAEVPVQVDTPTRIEQSTDSAIRGSVFAPHTVGSVRVCVTKVEKVSLKR